MHAALTAIDQPTPLEVRAPVAAPSLEHIGPPSLCLRPRFIAASASFDCLTVSAALDQSRDAVAMVAVQRFVFC